MDEKTIKLRERARERYYRNRESRIIHQREYDRNNKEKKNLYERKHRRNKEEYFKKEIQHYSQKKHFPILTELHKGRCQICGNQDKLQIHHNKYTRDINDCILVCLICHKKIHRKY